MGKKRKHSEVADGAPAHHAPPVKKKNGKNAFAAGKEQKQRHGHRSSLVFTPRPDWHSSELPELPTDESSSIPPRQVLDELHKYADSLLEADNTEYASSHLSSSSSYKFMSTIMSSGTLEDRVSALTLLVQESPVHTMKAFENLVGLAGKRSRSQALMALGALKDLLGQGVVLPPERKLRAFNRHPALLTAFRDKTSNWSSVQLPSLPGRIQKAHLISWAYEDWLKKKYFEILQLLEGWGNDEVEYARSRVVTFVFELLREKPEQEENLLRLLINKLGDNEKKIASRASYLLLQLQVTHPLMKSVIVSAIQSEFLFRPGQSVHAKYYAVITLNQTILSVKEQEVATTLLDVYFKLFLGAIAKNKPTEVNGKNEKQGGGSKGGKLAKKKAKRKEQVSIAGREASDKLISQILTGINRAFPYAKTDDAAFESQIDMIYKVTHSSNFNTSLQALVLLQQISVKKHLSADRFYRTLYESLMDPRLITSSKHIMYLNLLYRSLKADLSLKRVKAFVKRLLQILTLHEPPFACGVLFLISELINTFPSIKSMLDTPEVAPEDEEERYVDAPEDGAPPMAAETAEKQASTRQYNPRKRDPEYSNADTSCLWDLLPFPAHFHPSVSLFASRILHSEQMPAKPDPTLHTLMHFLDRFAYRNPKANAAASKGSSIMQPMTGADTSDRLIKIRGAHFEARLNTEDFWARKVEDIAADEVFFHNYFNQASIRKMAKSKKDKKKDKRGDESEGSGEEAEIWKALVSSRPEIEGGDGSESDEDLEGLEELMSEEADEDGGGDVGVELNLDSDGEDDEDLALEDDVEDAGSDDGFDAAELEDDEAAFVGSDEDLPSDFEIVDEEAASREGASKKSKRDPNKKKKGKLKHLPTFASAEDYAKLLQDDDDDEDV